MLAPLAITAAFAVLPAAPAQAECVPVPVNADLGVSPCYSFVDYTLCVALYYETPATGPGYDNVGPVCAGV